MSVLILAEECDVSANLMVQAVQERGTVVHRVDTRWFPVQLSVSAELNEGRWSGYLRTPYRTIDLDDITAVLFRSPRAYKFPDGLSSSERWHAHIEAKYGLGGVLTSLPARWVNHPARLADSAYKPRQLAIAHRMGLHVADTLITNEAEPVRNFAARGEIVTKVLGANTILEEGVRKRACTRPVSQADLDDLRGIVATTHLFQRWVPKSFEARVFVVGDTLTAIAIYASNEAAYVDYRADYSSLTYEQIDTPEDVAKGIRGLMDEMGLLYGALDFVVGPDDTWTFLEVNGGGQYGWLEHEMRTPITQQLADLLTTT